MPIWICPLDSSHRFQGDNTAWKQYLDHFTSGIHHSPEVIYATFIPDPSTPHYIHIDISSLFHKKTHIDYIVLKIYWYSSKTGEQYHFYQAYFKGEGTDENPHKLRLFHGVKGIGRGEFFASKITADPIRGRPANRIDLDRTITDIMVSSYEATKGWDFLDRIDIEVKGWL